MSFKEIKKLRNAGKLDEALEMANQAIDAEPGNIWNKRAAAWVYYDYLKKYAHPDSFDDFKENLIKIRDLQLPEDEKMVFDNSLFQIGKIVFKLQNENTVDYAKINKIFDVIKDFHFTKPSDAYSYLHKAFIKGYKSWSRYIEFADWWGLENIRDEDYVKETFNGRELMSLAEKIFIAYPKRILIGEPADPFGHSMQLDLDKIRTFIPKIDEVIRKHPDYRYAIYYKTKLLLALDKKEEALDSFIPFLKIKKNDFWVWELLGDIYSDDSEMQISCYCKALSLKTKEDFLINLRESLAHLLIQKGLLTEAKTEIEKAVNAREGHEWRLTERLKNWKNSDWYKTTNGNKNNVSFYKNNLAKAEEVLFKDISQEVIVVEYVNHDKNILNFIKNKSKHGFFNYSQFDINPKIGDVYKVRFEPNTEGDFYRILHIITTEESSEALKSFSGSIRVHPKGFGFVDDVFITQQIIEKNNVINGDEIQGKAILSYNKKKAEWGWKSINIINSQSEFPPF